MSEQDDLEAKGTGEAAKRIGNAPTTTDVHDPNRSSRNTAAGSGSEPGQGPVQPAADTDAEPEDEAAKAARHHERER